MRIVMVFLGNIILKRPIVSNINLTELVQNLVQLNSRPRKCLNFATPFEALIHEINLLS